MKLSDVKTWPKAQGKTEMLKHLSDTPLTLKQAVLAHCYYCTVGFNAGKVDCRTPDCPLHPFMPYREGGVRKLRKRVLTDDQRTRVIGYLSGKKKISGAL